MASYDITSWSELTAALLQAEGEGDDASIILNFQGYFTDTPVSINIPANVKICTINGDTLTNPNPVYNTRITTLRSDYFEMYINNLNLKISEDNPVIDIAKAGTIDGSAVNYNKLILSGTNLIENNYSSEDPCTNTCGIYVGTGTGLNIECLSDSVNTVNTIVNGNDANGSSSAAIGGKIGQDSGKIVFITDGIMEVSSIYNSGAQTLSSLGAGIGGGGGKFMGRAGSGGDIDISGNGTLNSYSIINGDTMCGLGAGIGGGGCFMMQAGSGGTINIHGQVNVKSESSNNGRDVAGIGAGIGGGGSQMGLAGSGGNITITDKSSVTAKSINNNGFSALGAGIGGGGAIDTTAGNGGTITISGEAEVNSASTNNSTVVCGVGAGIGGGGSNTGTPGDGGTINIHDNVILTAESIGNSGAGIGGGSQGSASDNPVAGNSGTIRIYGSAHVTASAEGYGAGIGGAGFGANTSNSLYTSLADAQIQGDLVHNAEAELAVDTITGGNADVIISENAIVNATSELGIGIGIGTDSTGDLTADGTVQITTSGSVTVHENDVINFAIGGGSNTDVTMTGAGTLDILGGVGGGALTITDKELVVDQLVYTDSLTFDNGYIIVNDPAHEQNPPDRGDYEIIDLTENGIPYTESVILKSTSGGLNSEMQVSDAGNVRMYLSDGEYYITESADENYKTAPFTVTSDVPHEPEVELPLTSDTARFTGMIEWVNEKEGTQGLQGGVIVSLYDSKRNRTLYGGVTDEEGKYAIYGVEPGTYYEGLSNIPNAFSCMEDDYFTKSGITKSSFTVAAEDEEVINARLSYSSEGQGERGEKGMPGVDGSNFPSSSINMLKLEGQAVAKNSEVDLGDAVEGNGDTFLYSPYDHAILLNKVGTFMINFSSNASYINEHSKEDYLAVQVKLGDEFIKQGFAYSWENGVLYGSAIIRVTSLNNNKLKLVNVGSQPVSIDNLGITIFNAS